MLRTATSAACKTQLDTEGRNLEHYNSATVAVDVEALRRALGVRQWVLLGHSYAARYAQTVARDFPASVEAMVLAAPAFPGLPGAESRAGNLDRALERAFDHCYRIGVCDADSLRQRFLELLRRLDEDPLVLTGLAILSHHSVDRLDLTGARLLRAVSAALYHPEFFEVFPFLVQQLEHDRTSILERYVLSTWFHSLLDETYSAPVRAAHYCAEEAPFVDYEAAARDAKTASIHVRRLVEIGFEMETQRCRNWDVAPAPSVEGKPVRMSIPTLFLQGALDPITPVDRLKDQLGNFTNHELLVFDDSSHWGSVSGGCAMEAAGHFVRHKRLEERHRQCAVPSIHSVEPQ